MTGAEIVALASVLATGFVAPYLAGRTATRTVKFETRRNREDELRAVMEAAAIRLTETITLVDRLHTELSILDLNRLKPLRAGLDQLCLNEDLMAVRLGRNAPEVGHYRNAAMSLTNAHAEFHAGLAEGFDNSSDKIIRDARRDAFQAQGEFFDSASRRVGPGDPHPSHR